MKTTTLFALFLSLMPIVSGAAEATRDFSQDLYALELHDIDGKPVKMANYKGKVLLIVNTASQCGFTPQLKALTELQTKYASRGFQVLGFPSNDFKQDKGSNSEVKKFAADNYQINFPLFDKAPVTGDQKQQIYKVLTSQRSDLLNEVQWNFEKFVVNRKGLVVERFRSTTKPDSANLVELLEKLLEEK